MNAASPDGEGVERKGQRTRRRILDAARRVFAEVGYERATIRGIAGEADADKSSVLKYFGSKETLFRESVHWDIPIAELTRGDAGETAMNYARSMLTAWAADPDSPMAVLLRNSMTSDEAAEILRTHVTAHAVDEVAATIDAADARLRSALVGAMLMGVASQRQILHIPDLVEAPIDDILRLVAPLVEQLIRPGHDVAPATGAAAELFTDVPAGVGSLGYRLSLVSRRARVAFERRLAEEGASFATWAVLEILSVRGPMIQRDLAESMDISGQTLTRHVGRLVSSEWVRRVNVEGDRRANLLELTEDGAAVHQRLAASAGLVNARLARGMSNQELATLHHLLDRVAENGKDAEEAGCGAATPPC